MNWPSPIQNLWGRQQRCAPGFRPAARRYTRAESWAYSEDVRLRENKNCWPVAYGVICCHFDIGRYFLLSLSECGDWKLDSLPSVHCAFILSNEKSGLLGFGAPQYRGRNENLRIDHPHGDGDSRRVWR